MRLIDADALEKNGWSMGRTYRADKDTITCEYKKPSDFPTIEPEPHWIPCSECVNYIDERCVVANYHVSEKENCMKVFGAKRRTVERRRA